VAERRHAVELAASFLTCLESIETFLTEAEAAHAYDDLLTMLRTEVLPNLHRFPNMGRPYLEQPPRSVEALAMLATLPPGMTDSLRVYLAGDYLILYVVDKAGSVTTLLSIRHHRQLSFDFGKIWNGNT
jgi:plasmid stabilization system protein ParE